MASTTRKTVISRRSIAASLATTMQNPFLKEYFAVFRWILIIEKEGSSG
jgi:hypothetical protein